MGGDGQKEPGEAGWLPRWRFGGSSFSPIRREASRETQSKKLSGDDFPLDSGAEGSLDSTKRRILVSFHAVRGTAPTRALRPSQLPTNPDPAAQTRVDQRDPSSRNLPCWLRPRGPKLPPEEQVPPALVGGRHGKQPKAKPSPPVEGIDRLLRNRTTSAGPT